MAAFLRATLAALWAPFRQQDVRPEGNPGFQAWLRAVLRNYAGDGAVSWVAFTDGCHFLSGG